MPCYFTASQAFVSKPQFRRFKTRAAAHAWARARSGTFYIDKHCKGGPLGTMRRFISTCQMGVCKPAGKRYRKNSW